MKLEKVSLINGARTPLQYLSRLSQYMQGPRIYMKREDMNGCIGLAGNKLRKLEYLLADALKQKCDAVITTGGLQSNHARATAAAARRLGLKPVLVLIGERPKEPLGGNLLLDYLLGAELIFTGDLNFDLVEQKLEETSQELKNKGYKPYIIPLGASNGLGTVGFVSTFNELTAQLQEQSIRPTWQVVTTGSGGTHAGILLGSLDNKLIKNTLGVSVVLPAEAMKQKVRELALAAGQLLNLATADDQIEEALRVDDSFLGNGYGIPTEECLKAIKLVAELEGILLDPTYTGKAMAGLLDYIKRGTIGPNDTVVFWHTGGQPGLLASSCFSLQ